MRLENYSAEKLAEQLKKIIATYVDINQYSLFFFGSRVSGRGDEHSDIDVGIEGSSAISSELMSKIKDEIKTLPLLYIIELVDFKNVTDDFYCVAKQHIEFII